jgi:hypothetical protein
MDRPARLHLVGRITYYVGWMTLLCGGLVHLSVARALFLALLLTQRNLFEVSVVCFVICIASELRARDSVGHEMPSTVKRQAAA